MKKDKPVCLITGASSGIGYAIASALKQEKYQLILTARRADRMKELAAENVDIIPGDLMSHEFIDSLDTHIFEKYKSCDYLFNCAGTLAVGTIEELDIDKMSSMMRLNVESTFRLTYKFLKRFKEQKSGHIINISSVLGTKVRPTAGAYAASKYAMEALSEALRMELSGTNIKVSCVEPGLVITELHDDWEVHPRESMHIHEPLTVKNIVDAIKFIMHQPDHVRIPKLMILPGDHHI
jgi:NADP-dependent 3-hydroxy acid dehydrogenase YdfG